MHRVKLVAIVTVAALSLMGSEAFGISRVGKRLSMVEFYGGYAKPLGSYTDFGFTDFDEELSASEMFDPSYSFAFSLGSLRKDHWFGSLGIRYTHVKIDDAVEFKPSDSAAIPIEIKFHQYDLDFNFNYYLLELPTDGWSPYAGLGVHAGLIVSNPDGYDTESELTFAASVNFGADLKIATVHRGKGTFSLASINSWNFMASGDRAKYLYIGGGLRYWFQP